MTEAISDVDYVESQFSRRPGHSPATTTPPDSGPSEDVTTPAEPGTDTTATPPNTASGTNTDRLIGWFASPRQHRPRRFRPRTRSQRCMFHIAGPGAHR